MDHPSPVVRSGATTPQRKAIPAGQLMIAGKWRDAETGETTDNLDPTTEAVTTQVAKGTVGDANAAVDAAHQASEEGPWGRMHHEERAKILFRKADLMDAGAEDLAIREAMDMGMPYKDFPEIIMPHCSGLFRFFGELAMSAMGGSYRSSYEYDIRILTRREPLGRLQDSDAANGIRGPGQTRLPYRGMRIMTKASEEILRSRIIEARLKKTRKERQMHRHSTSSLPLLFLFAALSFLPSAVSAQQAMPKHEGGAVALAPSTTIAEWPTGTFLESIAIANDGGILVANHESGTLERLAATGTRSVVAKLPGAITGIEIAPDGGALATGREKGGLETVYHIDPRGAVSVVTTIRDAKFLNGLTRISSTRVLIADSAASTIWQLDLSTNSVMPWLHHELLGAKDPQSEFPKNTFFPAANGIKRFKDSIYVSNSGRAAIVRIPLVTGEAAGQPVVHVSDVVADDFAFDVDGAIYAPTHPVNSVVRIDTSGTRTTIASCAAGVAGPTAVAFGGAADRSGLYIVGNSMVPCDGTSAPARLVRLEARRPGYERYATLHGAVKQVPPLRAFLVTAPTTPGSEAARQAQGVAYLTFLEANLDRIAFGAQVLDGAGAATTRIYVVQAESAEEARRLMASSPYFKGGVYRDLRAEPLQGMLGTLMGGVAWQPNR